MAKFTSFTVKQRVSKPLAQAIHNSSAGQNVYVYGENKDLILIGRMTEAAVHSLGSDKPVVNVDFKIKLTEVESAEIDPKSKAGIRITPQHLRGNVCYYVLEGVADESDTVQA